jgi:hypothetical protein
MGCIACLRLWTRLWTVLGASCLVLVNIGGPDGGWDLMGSMYSGSGLRGHAHACRGDLCYLMSQALLLCGCLVPVPCHS